MNCSPALVDCSSSFSCRNDRVEIQGTTADSSVHSNDTWSDCFESQQAHDTWHGDPLDRYYQEENDAWYAAQEALERSLLDLAREHERDEVQSDEWMAWLSRQAA